MDYLFLGEAVKFIGELFLAYTVLRVHHGVMTERRIDKKVLMQMKSELVVGLIGVILMLAGFIIRWTLG